MRTSALAAAPAPVVVPPRMLAGPVDVRPLEWRSSGTLTLASADAAGRTYVSAASGIAAAGGAAWVVSDEYGELARFPSIGRAGTLVPGLPRQQKKPDLEAIVRLPALDADAGATLLALGSGSAATRNRAVAVQVDAAGAPRERARVVDLSELYGAIGARLTHGLNIEGAAWRGGRDDGELLLFHRGMLAGESNVIVALDGRSVLAAARSGERVPASAVRGLTPLDLGTLGGSPLGFADARALPDGRIAFIASSEDSDGSGDGAIRGSAVGLLDHELRLTTLRPLVGEPRKAEGIEVAAELDPAAPPDRYVLVTDPDDPARATEVLTVDL